MTYAEAAKHEAMMIAYDALCFEVSLARNAFKRTRSEKNRVALVALADRIGPEAQACRDMQTVCEDLYAAEQIVAEAVTDEVQLDLFA